MTLFRATDSKYSGQPCGWQWWTPDRDWATGYGSQILLKHGDGVETRYAHLSSYAPSVSEGARVRQGEFIGMTGMTGHASGIHLHYEVLVDGRSVDPLAILLPVYASSDPRSSAAGMP